MLVCVRVMQAADLAAAPLTKTVSRESAVAFIDPAFMTFDLAILMKQGPTSSRIRNIRELGAQWEIKYGVVVGGSTEVFIRVTQTGVYPRMSVTMEAEPDTSYLQSVEEGVTRVCQSTDSEPFAFIGEKYMLEYQASHGPCELTVIDADAQEYTESQRGQYNLAARKGLDASTKIRLQEALTNLSDNGKLQELYDRWWA